MEHRKNPSNDFVRFHRHEFYEWRLRKVSNGWRGKRTKAKSFYFAALRNVSREILMINKIQLTIIRERILWQRIFNWNFVSFLTLRAFVITSKLKWSLKASKITIKFYFPARKLLKMMNRRKRCKILMLLRLAAIIN